MTQDPLAILTEGIRLQKNRDLAGAERCYARIPPSDPHYSNALNLLGTVRAQSGRQSEAAALMGRAVRANPLNVTAWVNLGSVLRDQGLAGQAAACLRRAMMVAPGRTDIATALQSVAPAGLLVWAEHVCLTLNPVNAHALIAQANRLSTSRDWRGVTTRLRKCLIGEPGENAAMFNLANALRDMGEADGAERVYQRAVVLNPRAGNVWNNWGLSAFAVRDAREALRRFRAASGFSPDLPQAWVNLGRAAQQTLGDQAALRPMRRSLLLDPNNVGAMTELAGIADDRNLAVRARCLDPTSHKPLIRLALFGAAEADRKSVLQCLKLAAMAEPEAPDAWYNLGVEEGRRGRPDPAVRYSHFATLIDDRRPHAHLNKALYLLLLERFEVGWEAHRRRAQNPEAVAFNRHFEIPEWDGRIVTGRHLLLWGEQGIGDEVQFLTLVPHLLDHGMRLTIITEPRLRPILRRSFPSGVAVPDVDPPSGAIEPHHGADCHLSLGDLPHRLRLFCGGDARPRPWIRPDAGWAAELRRGLQARHPDRILVGITWRSRAPKTGAKRTIPPALWRSLAGVPEMALVSLQYGARADDGEIFHREAGIHLDTAHGIEPLETLDGLVSLIAAVDLIVCPTNNTVHFAGAMGRRCLTLLPHLPDWRWGLTRETSLWYPDMRVVRQSQEGGWEDVMAKARDWLSQTVPECR